MEAHELARKLLAMPDECVFILIGAGEKKQAYHVADVELCHCDAEIFIRPLYRKEEDMLADRAAKQRDAQLPTTDDVLRVMQQEERIGL